MNNRNTNKTPKDVSDLHAQVGRDHLVAEIKRRIQPIPDEAKQAAEKAWDKYAPNRKPAWGRVVAEDIAFEIACNAADIAKAKLENELILTKACLNAQVPELLRAVNENLERAIKAEQRIAHLEAVAQAYDKVINQLPKDQLIHFANAFPEKYISALSSSAPPPPASSHTPSPPIP